MALVLYKEFMDMDYMDYSEHFEADLAFISALIESIGVNDTRKVLKQMKEA